MKQMFRNHSKNIISVLLFLRFSALSLFIHTGLQQIIIPLFSPIFKIDRLLCGILIILDVFLNRLYDGHHYSLI